MLERLFQLRRHNTSVRTEATAGATTFLTAADIMLARRFPPVNSFAGGLTHISSQIPPKFADQLEKAVDSAEALLL